MRCRALYRDYATLFEVRMPRMSLFGGQAAAAILITSLLSASALAQVPPPARPAAPAPVTAPTAAADQPLTSDPREQAARLEAESSLPPGVIASAPSVRANADVLASLRQGNSLEGTGMTDPDVPWILAPDQHPLPLHYSEPQNINILLLDIPSTAEARLMNPGRALDLAERARYTTSKYTSDAIGLITLTRTRQAEAIERWLAYTDKQAAALGNDPWQHYQFWHEARPMMEAYRAKAAEQTAPPLMRMVDDSKRAVAAIIPIVNLMPTHEARLAWYNVMVQLKEGLGLFQRQLADADKRVNDLFDGYLQRHPYVPRPAGAIPADPRLVKAVPQPTLSELPQSGVVTPAASQEAKPRTAIKASSGFGSGLLITGVLLVALAAAVLKMRGKAGKSATPMA